MALSHKIKKNKKVTNELLSEVKNEALDDGREDTTVAINPTMETMESGGGKNRNKQDECI